MTRVGCQGCRDGAPLPFAFTMAFQPIVDVGQNRVWGYEALVRGTEGQGAGWVLGQVDDGNRYKFDQACRVKAIELAASLFPDAETRLSINFMPNAVYEPAACIRATLEAAQRTGLAHRQVMFEFTENERMVDVAHVQRIIAEYRKHGFMTALDDFGAGYAGLNLLASFQPDLIKLDMELIRGIATSPARQTIIAAVTMMARELGITVLAEGIESEAEFVTLKAAGIRLFQGYHFARPEIGALPAVQFTAAASMAA
ncbi:Blue light- and temperature-regulated antirepressor BluF [Methylobacterium tardum]|uniref:Diguanylate phosphodiesterase n=1 Tax=Methylobacterium tardum TaxID=374432 RepID=A0AA37WRN9_9HYPH|nr:EAL domain-containing protein [Methylobacterium tardum]URD39533.1 EAL domain-containing protein [Methylobacterium tardum]GJE52900.1 Blue light- and temperature-regulated antirepressor BluF [Methylobacterium tardum]GLS68218.1 diguanylate phosphodiesterase [Methylobacterium tardum]